MNQAPVRWVDVAIGLLLVGCSIASVVASADDLRPGAVIAALVIGGLGLDALVSALRRRRSLVSRIGPLP